MRRRNDVPAWRWCTATLVVITYHGGGDAQSDSEHLQRQSAYPVGPGVPFQPFGFFALVILCLMAATSHDFWLANLSCPGLEIAAHAGVCRLRTARAACHVWHLQAEVHWAYVLSVGFGLLVVLGLHVTAARKRSAFRPFRR